MAGFVKVKKPPYSTKSLAYLKQKYSKLAMNPTLKTFGEKLYWSYANLARFEYKLSTDKNVYNAKTGYMIRAKLFKGLKDGSMNIATLFKDEKSKLLSPSKCVYCGATQDLSLDHIFPKAKGGTDSSDNLVLACKSCNSSKGSKDLMQWHIAKDTFPPLLILRIYLKLVIAYSIENNLLNLEEKDFAELSLPFNVKYFPIKFPNPRKS